MKVAQLCLTLCDPGQNTGVDSLSPSPGDLPNPGMEPRSPALHTDSLPAEPQGKEKKGKEKKGKEIFIGRTDVEAELQYPGHLMQRADSFEKPLMLGKIEGRRRRG